ncbi:leukocyte immunoglobulin-like receptor subfamily B member 3 isoform X9 [Manis pentadactyla]|uniref:leukocyte immunoglobulin-like receptor subfamily B member 3 isoform X9 n=1 Tax=Manis pentadactyla TaxID=143292 RepID=UPI00255CCC3F|nr:leukocyte immunoglobulin-like receptor subfamily B member 3 isoform X9 [Manis pentadactyla]
MSSALISLLCLGGRHKPSLSVWPSPVVPLGGHVTLKCQFPLPFATFKLFRRKGTRGRELQRRRSKSFTIDPVSVAHAGFYACSVALCHSCEWSARSDPLQIVVTGVLRRPSISAQPSSLVHAGASVTLCCHSRLIFDTFILHREGGTQYSQQHREKFPGGHSQARFSMGPLTPAHGGTYRCYGALSHAPQEWSAPSDPVDVTVTGQLPDRPSLSVQPGPTVASGEKVTLLCQSGSPGDTFLLFKEGAVQPPLRLRSKNGTQQSQAEFPMSPVTPAHGGTYRCYSANSSAPYVLSHPSDPLELQVSGPKWPVLVLVGVSAACALLLAVLLLLLLCRQRLRRRRKPGAADAEPRDRGPRRSSGPAADAQETLYATVTDAQPEGVEPDPQQSTQDEDAPGGTHTQVSRSRSRLSRGAATSQGMLLDPDSQAEEDRRMDSQAAAPDSPQEVTYAQLNHLTLRRETPASPPSQAGQPPAEPSVYAALATR